MLSAEERHRGTAGLLGRSVFCTADPVVSVTMLSAAGSAHMEFPLKWHKVSLLKRKRCGGSGEPRPDQG